MIRLLFVGSLLLSTCPQASFASEAAEKLVLATFKLSNDNSTATGFVINRNINGIDRQFLVSCDHVFEQMSGDSFRLVSRTKKQSGEYLRNEIKIQIRSDGNRLWQRDQENDVAVLRLPNGLNLINLPFECLATEASLAKVFTGDSVRSAVFPERSEANSAGFPVMRMGAIGSHPLRPIAFYKRLLVDGNTWKGDSGSAVMHDTIRYRNEWPMILGITQSMQNITDTVKESRYVQRRTDYPLGFAVVVHAEYARRLILNYPQ